MAGGRNIAGEAGRWSAAHWKTASIGWLVFVVAAMALGSAVGLNKLPDSKTGSGETARAEAMLRGANFLSPASESVLIRRVDGQKVTGDPRFVAAVIWLVRALDKRPEVAYVRSPLDPSHAGLYSKDGRAALIQFDISGSADTAQDRVQPALDAVAQAQ